MRAAPESGDATRSGSVLALSFLALVRLVLRLPRRLVARVAFWLVVGGLVLSVIAFYTQPPREASIEWQISHMLLAGLAVGLMFAAFGERSLWVILFSVVIFGYMLKPLGLVIATGLLVFVSAWGGHEFRVKEVTILSVALAVFSVFAFIRGLGLPMNIWPSIWE